MGPEPGCASPSSNKKTGVLSDDADDSGSREAVEFAQLPENLKLTDETSSSSDDVAS